MIFDILKPFPAPKSPAQVLPFDAWSEVWAEAEEEVWAEAESKNGLS